MSASTNRLLLLSFLAALGLGACSPDTQDDSGDGLPDRSGDDMFFAENTSCGDGRCDRPEVGVCAQDCAPGVGVCGNGVCGDGESPSSCPIDCGEPAENNADVGDNNGEANNGDGGDCSYPSGATGDIRLGQVMANLSWTGAYQGDGSQIDFSMEAFHCDPAYQGYDTILFVVTAGWCPACPDYIRYVHGLANSLEGRHMMVAFIEAENQDSSPASHSDAHDHISHIINGPTGLRIGDGETQPRPRAVSSSSVVTAFPSAFVVRRADMMVIADQSTSEFLLPLEDIASNPNTDWSDPANGGGGTSNPLTCGPEDEEIYEPNDNPQTAPVIPEGSFEGGVCAPAPDYYRIEHEGPWRVQLTFSHNDGDLDLFTWDFEANAPDEATGSASVTDNEEITGEGPATIMIYGYEFASAPYSLTLSYE